MRQRSIMRFRPGLEQFEARQLLSAGSLTTHVVNTKDGSRALALHSADTSGAHEVAGDVATSHASQRVHDNRRQPAPVGASGYLAFRVTNTPYQTPYKLVPPFQQVLVQGRKPVPGQVYNVTDVTVKNGTSQTFTASNGFTVRMTNQPRSFSGFPILTGNGAVETGSDPRLLRSDQEVLSSVLRRRGFPVRLGRQVIDSHTGTSGDLSSAEVQSRHVRPHSQLDRCVWAGQRGGPGRQLGLPNTSINQIVEARTQRTDFAGHF